ncbi:helix-turn-helix transcriptional regulator [Sinorhizobium medicae]|uniref:helix-turn-helix domain-containing protein n=1 Tax=Sinorhizobium medicae TaxID=110321 RepID=UPI002AF6CB5A|nr:helix-turn-helix transcriptional regulator [Sinorhizobium medicae]WQO60284.1 helix-turn-helix transcriptional regulator [Sinorhizobium medicae]
MEKHIFAWDNVIMAPIKKPKQKLQRTFLKEWREYHNLSQEAAASSLNVSRTLLSKIENAKSPYTQQLMENAAVAYGCEVPDLIMRNPLDRDTVWSLQEQLKKATPDRRNDILTVVEAMLRPRTGTDG